MRDFINPNLISISNVRPKIIESPLCLEIVGPKRRHRKKRIQKKYNKMYGFNYTSTAYHDKVNNVIFMHPEYKAKIEESIKKQAEDSALYANQMFMMNFGLEEVEW